MGKEEGLKEKRLQLFLLENLSWILIIAFYALFAAMRPVGMLQWQTLVFIIYSTIPLGFLVFGTGVCLISGRLDLSIAEMAGFVAMLSALILTKWSPGIPFPLDIMVPIVLGGVCGLFNGFLVGVLSLNPFLATLGTFMAFDGATILLHPYPIYEGFSTHFINLGGVDYIAIPIAIAILIVIQIILKYTRFGNHIYAVGGNAASSRMLGVHPNKMYIIIYTISGAFAGLSALFYTGFLHAVPPGLADGNVFLAFAGAIIGGINLEGGRGSMINAFAGVIFLGVVEAGLAMFNVSPFFRKVVYGFLVILAILINKYRATLRDKILLPKSA